MPTFVQRALITAATAGGALVLGAGAATAHVTVAAPGAAQGGYAVLTFQVPTESAAASTTQLTVTLPGFTSARTEPLPGWKATVGKDANQHATSVTWIADPGAGIPVGQFQRFVLSVGPLPKEPALSFPAEQTYSDGSVVKWDQQANPDGSEPEHPAPELTLVAASGDGHAEHAAVDTSADSAAGDSAAAGSSAAGSDDTARWLGGAGLVAGALGVALGLGALLRRRA